MLDFKVVNLEAMVPLFGVQLVHAISLHMAKVKHLTFTAGLQSKELSDAVALTPCSVWRQGTALAVVLQFDAGNVIFLNMATAQDAPFCSLSLADFKAKFTPVSDQEDLNLEQVVGKA